MKSKKKIKIVRLIRLQTNNFFYIFLALNILKNSVFYSIKKNSLHIYFVVYFLKLKARIKLKLFNFFLYFNVFITYKNADLYVLFSQVKLVI